VIASFAEERPATSAQLAPARFQIGKPVLPAGTQTVKPRYDSVGSFNGPVRPSPADSSLQLSQQTLRPPSPFVAIPTQFVMAHLKLCDNVSHCRQFGLDCGEAGE
jgi:hypothetical protein